MTPELFIEQNWPLSPGSYCYRCKVLLKPGDRYKMWRIVSRSTTGDIHIHLKIHAECP